MIGPKKPKPSPREIKQAYTWATTRDQGQCVRCGSNVGMQRDHRQNREPYDLNTTLDNLQLLCLTCHKWKTEHPEAAWREGFGVPRWAKPSEYPAARLIDGHLAFVLYYDSPDVDGSWWSEIPVCEAAEFFALIPRSGGIFGRENVSKTIELEQGNGGE